MEVVFTEKHSSSERTGDGLRIATRDGSKLCGAKSMKGKECWVLDARKRNALKGPGRTSAFPFDLTIM